MVDFGRVPHRDVSTLFMYIHFLTAWKHLSQVQFEVALIYVSLFLGSDVIEENFLMTSNSRI